MEIKTMPKDTLAELLFFLAENEDFAAVRAALAEGVSMEEVRAALRELAQALVKEVSKEGAGQSYNAQKDHRLSKEAKDIISYLSPGEEKSLLQAFGIIEKPKSVIKQ